MSDLLNLSKPFPAKEIGRFASRVAILDDCWEWIGPCFGTGYGCFNIKREKWGSVLAHRYAYELWVGPIPNGLQIDHLCFNRRCVNPRHLEPVTLAENLRRAAARITHCPQGHEYTPENTYTHGGSRKCRTCACARVRSRWHKSMSDPEYREKERQRSERRNSERRKAVAR